MTFDPTYRRAYVICELSSKIIGFNYDATNGVLTSFQTISTLPAGYVGPNSTAEIAFHPSGRFLYGSNRGHNSIAVFAVDPLTGLLTPAAHTPTVQTPRSFAIDPTGAYCLAAGQDSNDIRLYTIDRPTGLLSATSQKLTVSKPVCVLPYLTQSPQPVLSAQRTSPAALSINIGNSLDLLTYELHQASGLEAGMTWNLLATGVPGQTNFLVPTSAAQGLFRAGVVTNY